MRIGLEVHVQLKTKSKLFCNCPTDPAEPNRNICPICLGFPGIRPFPNEEAILLAFKIAKALNCRILERCFFSRKSYFYPDMPKNYQITQYEAPIGVDGWVDIGKKIRIRRVHLEEDPARLVHPGGIGGSDHVLIDYNRAGVPLVEIVTEPDFGDVEEVKGFFKKLLSILLHLRAFDPLKCSIRCDVNISLGDTRVEVKNVTGLKHIERAIRYEILRQEKLLKEGKEVKRETRHFDEKTGLTTSLREKEFEDDYGYIFDPDLPIIEGIEVEIPELPDRMVERFVEEYGLKEEKAKAIAYEGPDFASFFEEVVKDFGKPEVVASWMLTHLLKCLNFNHMRLEDTSITPKEFVEFLRAMEEERISERYAKEMIKEWVPSGKEVREFLKEMVSEEELRRAVEEVLREHRKAVEDYKKGKKKALEFLIGQVLRRIGGRADVKEVRRLLEEAINFKTRGGR